jgi:hypothetical protein
MVKATLKNEMALFYQQMDLNLRIKPTHCYIWNIAFYGAEN